MAISNGVFYSQTQGLKLSTNNFNRVVISTGGTTTFTGNTNGSTLIDVRGTNGPLMSVVDTLTGALLSVVGPTGNSIFQVNSDNSIIGGTPNSNTFVISGTKVGIGNITTPLNTLHVSASTDPVRFVGLQPSTNSRYVVSDSSGVLTYRTDVLTGLSSISAVTLSSLNVLTVTSNGGTSTATTINAVTGGTYSNGTITLSGTGNVNGTQITGLSSLTTTLYSGNGTLTGNRTVGLSSYTLNFSSTSSPNTLVLSSGNVGIGNSSPTSKLHVGSSVSFLKVSPQWFGSTGTWLDLSTDGPSGIGTGGPGVNPFLAYVAGIGQWFSNSVVGDIAYRNTSGKLLFGNTPGNAAMSIFSDNIGLGTVSPTNKLHVVSGSDPLKLIGVQTSTDTEVLSIDGNGVVHKISTSAITSGITATGSFLRNQTNASSTDTIQINESIFNPSNLTVLSTSTFIVDYNADYYILGDLYNYGSIIVNGTLKVGGIIYNYGTITGSGIIE